MSRPADLGPTPNRFASQWRDRLDRETSSAVLTLDGRLQHANMGRLSLSRSGSSLASFASDGEFGTWRPMTSSSAISFSSSGRIPDPSQPRPPLAFGMLGRRMPLPNDAPPVAQIETRWPGQRWGLGMPLRPSLRTAAVAQDDEGMRFFNGVWRARPATSPRAIPI